MQPAVEIGEGGRGLVKSMLRFFPSPVDDLITDAHGVEHGYVPFLRLLLHLYRWYPIQENVFGFL